MRAREKIYWELKKYGAKHPDVFKGWHVATLKTGWHYIEFNSNFAIYLGKSLDEAFARIQEIFVR